MNEKMLLGILITIFILFFILNRIAGSPVGIKWGIQPLEPITTEAGIGSILAGTFFGVVRQVILKYPTNFNSTLIIMICFFIWYTLTKSLALFINNSSKAYVEGSNVEETDDVKVKDLNEFQTNLAKSNKLPPLYGVLVSSIILLFGIILVVAFYSQRNDGNDKHIVNYNIIITCMVILAGFFTFITGKKIDVETKIRIVAYTISFAIIFGIFAPIFLFKSFSFGNLIISSLTFFVWLTLSYSFSNFLTEKEKYINRV